ncbi:uncharacterized protein N7483_005831 [Penicillium malachiteum]|uniref:uncharacterized protein n=1 Tax=Penicillium malachiteum TaxID=1324776 RepID=UPI002546D87D|nr:uncharacterized protein N7483_005831 [Penicillium malachiteum]KAJ5731323.1 hypothetical protein N7483_005831 [Penicillium malachiteum]
MSTLLPFRDKRLPPSKHIQHSLQTLIDAQSEGLLSGIGQAQPDNSSDGSSTPTSSRASRSRSLSATPARQPRPKKIGLRAAREGIFQSMYDLLKLREQEREILSSQSNERDTALREIQGFTSRQSGLEEAISVIHSDQENQRVTNLQEEARGLETDIHELETKLLEMKAKHRHLVSEIANTKNSVDAKLSSQTFKNTFVTPPVQAMSKRTGESTFYTLNPRRRTLEMAQELWTHEQEDLHYRQQEVDAEILALEEGGGLWQEALADVSGFEKRLRGYMRRYMQLVAQETDGVPVGSGKEQVATSVSQDLQQTTQRLESHLEYAEDKDWKLLVCCIAAELEALRQAKGLLLPAFGLPVPDLLPASSPPAHDPDQITNGNTHGHTIPFEHDDSEPPADLLKDTTDEPHTDQVSRSEDDDPDPAWLLES